VKEALTLLQNGKNEILDVIESDLENLENRDLPPLVYRIMTRMAEFLFLEEKYSDCDDTLYEATKHLVEYSIPIHPKLILDASNVAWELGEDAVARSYLNDLKPMASSPTHVIDLVEMKSRSKYLCTKKSYVEISHSEATAQFKLTVATNIAPVNLDGIRNETVPRKLPCPFFIETHFENTSSTAPCLTFQEVTTPEFQIESPIISPAVSPRSLYEVTVLIYKDKEKKEYLGAHHQLVYAIGGFGRGNQVVKVPGQ